MKLWLDDVREPPDLGWTWVKTVTEAIRVMETGKVTHASLDHELGEDQPEGRRLVLWMAENDIWPSESLNIHSGNVVGVQYMTGVVERYGPFEREHPNGTRFSLPSPQ
jgi:two-component sensor histidine kinase